MNKNLSEFENKLPSALEYDTQQLLDYYYESPEKMKIAEVFSEFLIEKGIKVELKEIGEYQYIHEIETGYYLLPLFVGGGTTDKKMSVSINIHLFHEKYFPEGMKNWNGSQMNLNYKDSLVQAFENWFNYDRLNYLKLVNPDKTDLRRIEINGKKKIIVSGNVKTIYNYDEEKYQGKEREENFLSNIFSLIKEKISLKNSKVDISLLKYPYNNYGSYLEEFDKGDFYVDCRIDDNRLYSNELNPEGNTELYYREILKNWKDYEYSKSQTFFVLDNKFEKSEWLKITEFEFLPKIKLKYVEKPSWKKLEENFGNLKEMDRGHEGDFAFTMAEVLFDRMIHCGYNVRLVDDWVYDFDNECYLLPLLSTKDYKTIPHDDIYQVVTTIQVHNKKYFPEGKLYIQKLIGEPLYDAIWINYRNWINNDYKKLCKSI